MVTDQAKSLAEGAIVPWRRGTKRMQAYYKTLQGALVKHFGVDEFLPFSDLPEPFKQALYYGTGDQPVRMSFGANGKSEKAARPFEGLVPQLQRLYVETESEFTRNRIRSFMTRVPCQVCKGARLKPEILAVTIRADNGNPQRQEGGGGPRTNLTSTNSPNSRSSRPRSSSAASLSPHNSKPS